jgi:phospholipid/cholesterol/gamma-HCH transport system substrate-binding protein
METRANHIVIGLFALAVIAAGMAFIYWVAEFGNQDETAEIIFQFNGPVNGLGTGSPVLFNGIQVGEVRTLSLNPNNPREALALAVVDSATPVRTDTEASLGITGITGSAFIALRGGSMDEPAVLDPTTPVIIEAEISAVQDLIDGARNVLGRADDAMQTIENFLFVNEPFPDPDHCRYQ